MLCPYSLSCPGGVQGQAAGLTRALRRLGHEAVLLAPVDGPLPDLGLPDDAVLGVGRSWGVPANGSIAPLALGPLASLRAVRTVRGGCFDVVHVHEPLAPGPGLACLVACRQPKVGTFHRSGSSFGYRVLGLLGRPVAARLSIRCAVSPAAEETAARCLRGSYRIVGNGVELERFAGADPWPTQRPTVLFVGRHEPRKGLDVLLEARRAMVGGGAEAFDLWIAGHGPDTARLRQQHPDDGGLQWLGLLDDDALARRLAGAHIVCAPSRQGESFGVVLLEAMGSRCAVVASDLPGYVAVAQAHARWVRPGDAGALAAALRDAVSDAAAGTGHSSAAALDAATRHAGRWSMDAVAAQYVAIYSEALQLPCSSGPPPD